MISGQAIFSPLANFPFWPLVWLVLFSVYFINIFFIIYHLTRFGIGTKPKLFALIFFLGAVLLFAVVFYYSRQIDFGILSSGFSFPGFK